MTRPQAIEAIVAMVKAAFVAWAEDATLQPRPAVIGWAAQQAHDVLFKGRPPDPVALHRAIRKLMLHYGHEEWAQAMDFEPPDLNYTP